MALYTSMTPGCRIILWTDDKPLLEFTSVEWTLGDTNTWKGELQEGGPIPELFNIVLYAMNEYGRTSEMHLYDCIVDTQDGLVLSGSCKRYKPWKEKNPKADRTLGAALNFENVYDSHKVIGRKTAIEGSIKNLIGQLALYGDGKGYWKTMPAKIKVKLEVFYPEGWNATEETEDAGSGTGYDETATQGSD